MHCLPWAAFGWSGALVCLCNHCIGACKVHEHFWVFTDQTLLSSPIPNAEFLSPFSLFESTIQNSLHNNSSFLPLSIQNLTLTCKHNLKHRTQFLHIIFIHRFVSTHFRRITQTCQTVDLSQRSPRRLLLISPKFFNASRLPQAASSSRHLFCHCQYQHLASLYQHIHCINSTRPIDWKSSVIDVACPAPATNLDPRPPDSWSQTPNSVS